MQKTTTFQIFLFSTLAATSLIFTFFAFRRVHTRRHYRIIPSIRLLFPTVCIISSLESAHCAASGHFNEMTNDKVIIFMIITILPAFKVPMLLVTIFELTFLVHKRRSVNFCGIYFDEGRRIRKNQVKIITLPMKSFLARNMIRALGLCLLVTGIIVNLGLLDGLSNVDEEVGRVGWYFLWNNGDIWTEQKSHILLSLLPTTVFSFFCFYLTVTLWRYGTESAMVVHSSCVNPWFYPFFGTFSVFCGQLFPKEWYPFTSNVGFLVLIGSILHLMSHIDKDVTATSELNEFLGQISRKGYMITLLNETKNQEDDCRSVINDDEVT